MSWRDRVLARSKTNWRAVVPWLVMGLGVSIAFGFAFSGWGTAQSVRRDLDARPAPCVQLANGEPSKRCEELLRLLLDTCARNRNPRSCGELMERVVASSPPSVRRRIVRAVERGLKAPPPPRVRTAPTPAPERERGERPRTTPEDAPSAAVPAPSSPSTTTPTAPDAQPPVKMPDRPVRDVVRDAVEGVEDLSDSVTKPPVETPAVTVEVPVPEPVPVPPVTVEVPTVTVPPPEVELPGEAQECVPTPVFACP